MVNHSAREVERLKRQGVNIKTEAPEIEYYEWTDKATGEVKKVPVGIDPGWDYNPGEAAWGRTQALRLAEDQGPWEDFEPRRPQYYGRPKKIPIDAAKARPWWPPDKSEKSLREALRRAIGGDEVLFNDPAGGVVMVTQAIVDHMLEKPSRIDGREVYFPFIPELIEDPYEIWIGFAKSKVSGRVAIRKRYVKAVRIDKNRVLGLWAEIMQGQWVSKDFFRGGMTGANNMRKGRLVYGRE